MPPPPQQPSSAALACDVMIRLPPRAAEPAAVAPTAPAAAAPTAPPPPTFRIPADSAVTFGMNEQGQRVIRSRPLRPMESPAQAMALERTFVLPPNPATFEIEVVPRLIPERTTQEGRVLPARMITTPVDINYNGSPPHSHITVRQTEDIRVITRGAQPGQVTMANTAPPGQQPTAVEQSNNVGVQRSEEAARSQQPQQQFQPCSVRPRGAPQNGQVIAIAQTPHPQNPNVMVPVCVRQTAAGVTAQFGNGQAVAAGTCLQVCRTTANSGLSVGQTLQVSSVANGMVNAPQVGGGQQGQGGMGL